MVGPMRLGEPGKRHQPLPVLAQQPPGVLIGERQRWPGDPRGVQAASGLSVPVGGDAYSGPGRPRLLGPRAPQQRAPRHRSARGVRASRLVQQKPPADVLGDGHEAQSDPRPGVRAAVGLGVLGRSDQPQDASHDRHRHEDQAQTGDDAEYPGVVRGQGSRIAVRHLLRPELPRSVGLWRRRRAARGRWRRRRRLRRRGRPCRLAAVSAESRVVRSGSATVWTIHDLHPRVAAMSPAFSAGRRRSAIPTLEIRPRTTI